MLAFDFEDRIVPPERLAKLGLEQKTHVLVIGSGAGGAALARELALAGLDVAILEEGSYLTARDYGSKSPLESVRMIYRNAGMTFTVGNQGVLLPVGRCVGGTTVINSGTALRAHPEAIRRWKEEFGLESLYENHDRIYASLERDLNVVAVRPEITGENTRIFRGAAEMLRWQGGVLTRIERGCKGAGRCYLGCPNDAKQAMNVSFVPDALRARARLFTRCRVSKILVEGGRAIGAAAVARPKEGRPFPVTFRAEAVVVSGGALFSPNLLRTAAGVDNPHIGRHLQVHPASRVIGLFDREVRGWLGVPQAYHVDGFLGEGVSIEGIFLPPSLVGPSLPFEGAALDATMNQFDRMAMIGYRILERSRGRVLRPVFGWPRSFPMVSYSLLPEDVRRFQRATALSAELLFAAGAKKVFTGVHPFEVLSGPADLERLKAEKLPASSLELTAYHAQGTCRMADHPGTGAVSPSGESWDVRDLYVADASVMPSTPWNNPQLSIMCFALHIAERLIKRYNRTPRTQEVTHTHH
jgi:choline dehydrogenase-like flavoprotein